MPSIAPFQHVRCTGLAHTKLLWSFARPIGIRPAREINNLVLDDESSARPEVPAERPGRSPADAGLLEPARGRTRVPAMDTIPRPAGDSPRSGSCRRPFAIARVASIFVLIAACPSAPARAQQPAGAEATAKAKEPPAAQAKEADADRVKARLEEEKQFPPFAQLAEEAKEFVRALLPGGDPVHPDRLGCLRGASPTDGPRGPGTDAGGRRGTRQQADRADEAGQGTHECPGERELGFHPQGHERGREVPARSRAAGPLSKTASRSGPSTASGSPSGTCWWNSSTTSD